ncbi:unnamed protein product [Caenorhabditis sp. 36 PRJEB53466]|nr:unnamed protein product [Caenorhabditis sp. 36 PRJEB53466]
MSQEHVADSWEDADADPVKELMEKVEKVKILQRKEEKKEAFFEKVKAEESGLNGTKFPTEEGSGLSAEEPKRVFLRRPKDGFAAETVIDLSSPPSNSAPEPTVNARGRSEKSSSKESKQPAPTLEERQAAYQAARDRILGSEYKPDSQEIKEIKFIDRSKSPETLRMTEQNMVEHYGEELSRELMTPAEPPVIPPSEITFVPDFSQPPPNLPPHDGSEGYNGPPGFQQMQQHFPPPHQHQHYMENPFYVHMNNPAAIQFQNQAGGFQQYRAQQEASAISSCSQNSAIEPQNEQQQQPQQTVFYCQQQHQQQQQQQMAYVPYNLPNMAYPPPNFTPQGQQSQQMMMNQMNHPQMIQMQQQHIQQSQGQRMNNFQVPNGQNPRGGAVNGGVGRGQNRQLIYQMVPPMAGQMAHPPPMAPQVHQNQKGQAYNGRNGGSGGQGQQRQFQQNQQNGQFQNVQNAGRKNVNKNGKTGARNDGIPQQQQNNFTSQAHIPMNLAAGQNPIPFGCPPRQVNAIREQYGNNVRPNPGAGLLGPHPLMQWNPNARQ